MTVVLAATAALAVGAAQAQPDGGAATSASMVASAPEPALPPSADEARTALERSPRHAEWVDVKTAGAVPIRTYVVYPERRDAAPVVLVIHEIFGLTDWIRGVADRLAENGFIAAAPDLISGMGPGGGGSDSVASRDDRVRLIRGLEPAEASRRLDAVRAYALGLPAANGRSATVGFCWGGSRSFAYGTTQPGLDAVVVFYGSAPDASALARLEAPVLGLYGGDDARVVATIEPAAAEIRRLGKSYEYEVYEGAGHGFLRQLSGREGANLRAARKAWPRAIAFLREHTRHAR